MSKQAFQWPKGQSRYMVLADRLLSQIQQGNYKPGDLLPGEAQLCAGYGVSRFTARQAIQELQKRGFVVTHHGIGSEVNTPRPADGEFSFSFDSVDEFLGAAKDLRLIVDNVANKTANDVAAKHLGCDVGDPYLFVEGRRVTKKTEEPVASTELYIPAEFAGVGRLLGRSREAVSRLIENRYKVHTVQIHQTIEPIKLDRKKAKSFDLPQGSAGLLVSRTYVDTTEVVFLHVRSVHAGKYARLSFEIRRKPT